MPPLEGLGPRLWLELDRVLGLLAAALLAAAGVWLAGRWSARREARAAAVLTAVMGATVSRRDVRETLGRLLVEVVAGLGAAAGTLHLLDRHGRLVLVHAERVEAIGPLAQVEARDPLAARLLAGDAEVVVAQLQAAALPWAALGLAPAALGAVAFGDPRRRRGGVLVASWPSLAHAHAARGTLAAIGRYAGRVLDEFEAIEQRAHDLQVLGAELQRREALARTTAHDLLNKLTFACDTVAAALPEARPPGDALPVALAQLRVAGQMLEDLRDPDRPLERGPVRVEALVELAAGLMALHAADQPVVFRVEAAAGLPDVWGDPLELGRVLDNLLTNAVRHNAGAELTVSLRLRPVTDGLRVEVEDNGRGVPTAARAALFEFGVTVDATGRARGHGMGLWSCRRIVAAHGGRIWVEDPPDGGARFCFTVPVTPVAQTELAPVGGEAAPVTWPAWEAA